MTIKSFRTISKLLLLTFTSQSLLFHTVSAQAAVTVAPNLMVIMSTSYSMNKLLSDTGYPALTAATSTSAGSYKEYNDLASNAAGHTLFSGNAFANQPGSKLYEAKSALLSILNSSASNNVNIGFATYRMVFGQQTAATTNLLTSTYPAVEPADPTVYTQNTTQKSAYATSQTNFTSLSWWRDYVSASRFAAGSACATLASSQWPSGNSISGLTSGSGALLLGNNFCDGGKGVINDSAGPWLTAVNNSYGISGGGLPEVIQNVPLSTTNTALVDKNNSYSSYSHSYPTTNNTGVTGTTTVANPTALPQIKHYLCGTGYDSQTNYFNAVYIADTPFINSYTDTAWYIGLGATQFNSSGTTGEVIGKSNCPQPTAALLPARTLVTPYGTTVNLLAGQAMYYDVTTVYNSSGGQWQQKGAAWIAPADVAGKTAEYASSAYYNSTPSGIYQGVLDGWSGESTYTCNSTTGSPAANGACANTAAAGVVEKLVVNYPSYVANPNRSDRKLVTNNWELPSIGTPYTPNHMGVFLDLPTPSAGYIDQRATINGFMGLTQMHDDGSDYIPSTQSMAPITSGAGTGNYGVSASSYSWGSAQSPIYDSLNHAYQYYQSYKAQDPYNGCRNNYVLLLIDGKEDARFWTINGVKYYADPSLVATELNNIGVKVYVIIMSTSSGDVAAANAIAQNGGTVAAYPASSPTALLSALGAVFAGLSGDVNSTSVAVPTSGGSVIYSTVNSLSPSQGHVDAYQVTGGIPATTPTWDAATLETVTARQAELYSTGVYTSSLTGPITLLTALDSAAFNTTAANDANIINYTINPSSPCTSNCNSSTSPYLAGRAPNAYLGDINGDQSAVFLNPPDDPALISDSTYLTYANSESARPKQLLFSSQDGFLYSIYQDGVTSGGTVLSGNLSWGWMPRDFVPNLQYYNTFAANNYGNGGVVVLDAKNASGTWATYAAGALNDGAVNYAIQLDSNGAVSASSQLIYDDYRPNGVVPNVTAPAYLRLNNLTYMIYFTNAAATVGSVPGAASPTLVIRELDNGTEPIAETTVPFTPNSNFFLLNGSLYIGDNNGNLWLAPLLNSAANAFVVPSFTNIGSFFNAGATDTDHKIKYVGGIMEGNFPYIYAQSTTRITVFNEAISTGTTTQWYSDWTSYTGGAGTWDTTGAYTASTVGAIPAGTNVPTTGVQWLPPTAQLLANSSIINNSLVVPVTIPNAATVSCGTATAYYYLYNLLTGAFPPAGTFVTTTGGVVTGNVYVGIGNAYSPSYSVSGDTITIYSTSQQNSAPASGTGNTTGSGGGNMNSTINSNRLIWWQMLNN